MPSQAEISKILGQEAGFKAERVREPLENLGRSLDLSITPVKLSDNGCFVIVAKKFDDISPKYVLQAKENDLLKQARRLVKSISV